MVKQRINVDAEPKRVKERTEHEAQRIVCGLLEIEGPEEFLQRYGIINGALFLSMFRHAVRGISALLLLSIAIKKPENQGPNWPTP